jgi:adenylyltransferase/sulfurtransferase
VDSAARSVAELNPHVRVVRHYTRLDATNALELLGGYQLVLDGTDNFATRYLVNDACALLRLPLVWGSIFRFDGQVSVFWSAPPAGEDGIAPEPVTYRDLHPSPPPAGAVPSCAEGGVLGVVCAAIGAVMATEAIKLICGIGDPLLGRLMVFDALAMSWRTIRIRPLPGARPITALDDDYHASCAVGMALSTSAPGDLADSTDPLDATITVEELAEWLARRERGDGDFALVDVREPGEREIARIPGAVSIPLDRLRDGGAKAALQEAAKGRRVVLHCKSGGRSAQALVLARQAGFADALHVAGGVLAWIDRVDPGQLRY